MLSYDGAHLCLDGHRLDELAARLGTPVFLASEARLRRNLAALRSGLSELGTEPTLRYCAKTNCEAGLLRLLADCGSHLLCSHVAEVELALACGFPADRLAYQQPVLLEAELERVVDAGVPLVHAYRGEDLAVLERVARRLGRKLGVSLRLRSGGAGPTGFLARRLGLDGAQMLEAAGHIGACTHLRLAGINFYAGTQQRGVERYRRLAAQALELARELGKRLGRPLEELNLGGGVPSPSLRRNGLLELPRRWRDPPYDGDAPLELEAFARELAAMLAEQLDQAALRVPPRIALEPGRSIVGNAVVLLTRVRALQGRWAFLDASRSHLGESPLLFTRRILPARRADGTRRRVYHLSGRALNTQDVLDLHRRLPPLEPDDLLVLCDAGAYSISRATRYADLPPALYVARRDGALQRVRRAEGLADLTGPMELAGGAHV